MFSHLLLTATLVLNCPFYSTPCERGLRWAADARVQWNTPLALGLQGKLGGNFSSLEPCQPHLHADLHAMFALPHKGYRVCGFFLDFPALFPPWQWWGRVRSCKETWLYLLPYGFSPAAFDKPWQCSPPHSTYPKPAETDTRKESPVSLQRTSGWIHSVWGQCGAAADAKSLSQRVHPPDRAGKMVKLDSVSEGWGNSRARRIWQEIYALARQHRTQIRLRNGNALPWAGLLWTWSSFRHHLASLPVLTSASLWRPLGLIFRLRD